MGAVGSTADNLKEAAEKAKMELSASMETDVNLPFITADASGPKHLNIRITRAKLESLVADLLDRLDGPCRTAIKDAGFAVDQGPARSLGGACISIGVPAAVTDEMTVDLRIGPRLVTHDLPIAGRCGQAAAQ